MIKKIKQILSKDRHLTELIRGSFTGFLLKMFSLLLGYASMVIITNLYGAEGFGVFSLVLAIATIFTIIPKFGMDNALVRIIGEIYVQKHYGKINYIVNIITRFTFFLSIVFAFILYKFSNYIAVDILEKEGLLIPIKIISISIVSMTIISIVSAIYQGMRKTKTFIFIQTILSQAIFIVLLSINYFFHYFLNIIDLYVCASILAGIISMVLLQKQLNKFDIGEKIVTYKEGLSSILKISAPMLLAGTFAMLMNWTDILMLGIYKTEVDVGLYSTAQKVSNLTTVVLVAVNAIAAPKFVEFYVKKDISGLEKITQQSTKLIFFASLPLLMIFMIFPNFVMNLFGNEFILASTVLIILTLGQFINAISGSVGYIMQMTDNQVIFQNIIVIAAIINIVLNYFFIPTYGINGAAFASMISVIFWNISLVVFIKIKLGFWTLFIVKK